MNAKKRCHFCHKIDLFGKEIELYYKGEPKKSTLFGRILTFLFLIIYVLFFIYKVIRMLLKIDVTFYEFQAYTGEVPSIQLSNENFYGGFALADPDTMLPYIDPTIYNIQAFFRSGKRVNGVWNWLIKPVPLEICKLEKFSPKYQELFKDKPLSNMFCPKEIDFTLEGHTTYDTYSFFYIGFYPCVNTSTFKICKPSTEIDKYLKKTYVSFKMQDIELTPQVFDEPTILRGKELSSPAWKSLYQNINSYFKIVSIETDNDVLGFEALSDIKIKKFLKYDQAIILSHINEDTDYQYGKPLCDVTIQLAEQILTIKRTYTKLVEVLGDVGGLMEVFLAFFKLINELITGLLYQKSLVNHLFNFDLEKKTVIIKEKKNLNNNDIFDGEDVKIYVPKKSLGKLSTQVNSIYTYGDHSIPTKNKLNEEDLNISKFKSNENLNLNRSKKGKKRKKNHLIKSSFARNLVQNEMKEKNSGNLLESEENLKKIKKKKIKVVKKIKFNSFCVYCCICCLKKRKIVQNILIEEGMKIISENLDIFNIFIRLQKGKKEKQSLIKEKEDTIKMSDVCQKNLKDIHNSLYEF